MSPDTIAFAAHDIDRADNLRVDAGALAQLRTRGDALLIGLDGLWPQVGDDDALVFHKLAGPAQGDEVFLGLKGGAALFAQVPATGDLRPAYQQRPIWQALARLSGADLALYGGARSLVDWHARHRFCANCGKPTLLAKGGWQRNCAAPDDPAGNSGCGAQHFPRVDPVAIMLVEHDGDLLLGRGAQFPARSYSALAGFVEPGESIEQAVRREVFEEVGVVVGRVDYIASQPWPFPSQLMIGCIGQAEARDLTIDPTEIEDARWFTRAEVADALARGRKAESFVPPPAQAIAHAMLHWWLEKTT